MKSTYLLFVLLISTILRAQEKDSLRFPETSQPQMLKEVSFSAAAGRIRDNIATTQMGRIDLPVTVLAKVPTIGGEPDIIKALQLTPGVKRGTEGGIGTYVRGGGKDENLMLLDGAPVYNAGHMLGFFSVFNTAALKEVQLYKSSFPSQYGGRLSSVMDITTKDGSMQTFRGNASLGLISSSMTVQGPVIKDKLSVMISGRRTYADKVFNYIPYYFYDLNAKINYKLNERDRLSLSIYKGSDVMDLKQSGRDSSKGEYTIKSSMKLGNDIASLRWSIRPSHERFKTDIIVYYSGFSYQAKGEMRDNRIGMASRIRDIGTKADWTWQHIAGHDIRSGFQYAYRSFNPRVDYAGGSMTEQIGPDSRTLESQEAAVYLNDDITLNEQWQLSGGFRLSGSAVPHKVYINPEPRLGLRYLINDHSSVKASYARMVQYMQLVSSSSLSLPSDMWYPVSKTIKPGLSDQISAGYYYAFPEAGVSISGEVYHKWMQQLTEYKEGAQLIMNDAFEKEMLHGSGRSYGLELFVSKTSGRFTGWVGYSLAYATRRFDSLNSGKNYYARYDRRHEASLVLMYDISSKWNAGAVVQYATGSPFTGQQSQYIVPKPDYSGFDMLPVYSSRNALRLSSSFRIDLDLGYKFRLSKHLKGDAHLNVYNILNRTQPYAVQRVYDESKKAYVYQQKGIFGTIPSLAVNFNF